MLYSVTVEIELISMNVTATVSRNPRGWKQSFWKLLHVGCFVVWFREQICSCFAVLTHAHLEVQKGLFGVFPNMQLLTEQQFPLFF